MLRLETGDVDRMDRVDGRGPCWLHSWLQMGREHGIEEKAETVTWIGNK